MNDTDVAREIAAGFAQAWNQHDMTELGLLFHDDAGFVNVVGRYMRGRPDIQRQHAAAHEGPYRTSTLQAEVDDASELVSGLIVAHVSTEVRGDDRTPGQVRRSIMTLVIQRRANLWRIAAGHNTIVAVQS